MSNPVSHDHALMLQWLIGAVIVLLYAKDRFKNPMPTRKTTTFWRYWAASFGYTSAMLMLYVFVGGGFTTFNPQILNPIVQIPTDIQSLPGPLLSALVLTSFLPHVPVLAAIDERIKRFFWRVGNIPHEVRILSARVELAPYVPGEVNRSQSAFSIDPSWPRAPRDSLKFRLFCCYALFEDLDRWTAVRGFARYRDENKPALEDIQAKLQVLSRNLDTRALEELESPLAPSLVASMRRRTEGDVAAIWRALCDFVAGGVLSNSWNESQLRTELKRLGFDGLPKERPSINPHDIVLVVGLVFIALLFIPLMMKRFFFPELLPMKARVLVMVPIVYAIAIVLAIYPKGAWEFASRAAGGSRPVAAYAASGLLAALAALLVSVFFRFAFDTEGNVFQALSTPGAFGEAWKNSLDRWPWLLLTFFATVSIAWAADDYQPPMVAPPWLAWVEAGALALVFGTVQWMVVELLVLTLPREAAAKMTEALPRLLVTSSAIGAAIGGLVPSLYRSRSAGTASSIPPASPATQHS